MAIKKQTDFPNGFSAEYIRISNIWITNGSDQATVTVQLWKDQDTRLGAEIGKKPVEEFCVMVELDGESSIVEQCYNGLKQLSDFTGAEDI